MEEKRIVIKKGKGNLIYKVRLSKANKKSRKSYSGKEAVHICQKIYPELERENPSYWRIYCVHHIDKNPFNNDPNNLAIVLKSEHQLYHRKKYNWKTEACRYCKQVTVHLNNRCTICRKKKREVLYGKKKNIL